MLIAAKLPADAMTVRAIGGASFLTRRTVSAARPDADGDQRRLRAEHGAEAERGEGGEDDAEEVRCRPAVRHRR